MLLGIVWLFIFLHQLLEHQAFPWVSGLCVGATDNITTPGFGLIVSLTVLLWLYCFGRIINCIALIALTVLLIVWLLILSLWLLWPYCWSYCFWLYCFDHSDHIADCIAFDHIALIAYILGHICARNCSLLLVSFSLFNFKVQAV